MLKQSQVFSCHKWFITFVTAECCGFFWLPVEITFSCTSVLLLPHWSLWKQTQRCISLCKLQKIYSNDSLLVGGILIQKKRAIHLNEGETYCGVKILPTFQYSCSCPPRVWVAVQKFVYEKLSPLLLFSGDECQATFYLFPLAFFLWEKWSEIWAVR